MKKSRERVVFILMGLLIGFALGISILFWRQSLSFSQRAFDKTKEYIVSFFKSEEYSEPTKNIVIQKKNNKKKKIIHTEADTLAGSHIDSDSLNTNVSTDDAFYADEAFWYDEYSEKYISLSNKNSGEEIARDKLLFKKQIEAELVNKEAQNKASTNIDSLLIGGKAPSDDKKKFVVEFWESPLNYKGYKKNKNLLVLYGIKQADMVQLKLLNNDLYLCFSDNYYALENSNDFRNLVPVASQQIINQLKGK